MTNWNQTRGLNSISMTRRLMNQTVQLVPALLPSRSYERTFLGWLRWSLLNKSSVVVLVFPSVLCYSCSFTFRHCLHKPADMCFLSPCLSLSPIFLLLPHIQGLVVVLVLLLHLQLQLLLSSALELSSDSLFRFPSKRGTSEKTPNFLLDFNVFFCF